ncbi:alpha/beta hydrolase-fold protein [Marinitoga arctica]
MKKRKYILAILILFISSCSIQKSKNNVLPMKNNFYTVTIIIEKVPNYTPKNDDIFISGNFNKWNPGENKFKLKYINGRYQITLKAKKGESIQFKFTRGNWESVEKGKEGEEIPNRIYTFKEKNKKINIIIHNWRDFVEKGKGTVAHTITGNVKIIDDFYLKELDKKRRIWIYLPPDYNASNKRYPVLYMHDGQNIFDKATSFSGEWGVDETLEKLFKKGKTNGIIVVAVDNSGIDRLNEYSPWKWENTDIKIAKNQGGKGDAYIDSIVKSLKPYIDSNYRTIPEDNGIMGSSMGGLISLYGALKYPDIFKKVGALSSAFWYADRKIFDYVKEKRFVGDIKIYLYVGGKEGENPEIYKNDTIEMKKILDNFGYKTNILLDDFGIHNESYWSKHFEEIFLWLYNK